jgi:4-amino-4-deoxy-L-arabinose transferase-like glycosyltransferase
MNSNPDLIPGAWNWLWLFNAWDSLQFPRIAMYGYVHPNYVYLPAYPILIFLVGKLTGDFWFGAFLIAQTFALASIVVFQLLAEHYMQPREALYASLLMATFPFVSVFTTLSYSEPVFLFFTISSWYLYKKGKIGLSSLMAGIASMTRIYGAAIILPMLLDMVKLKRYRKLAFLIIPVALLSSWFIFCYFSSGDPFASWTDEKYWQKGELGEGFKIIQAGVTNGIGGILTCCAGIDPTIFWSLALFVILIVMTWHVDRPLWIYSAALSSVLVFTTSYYVSLLRYLAFIFPIWLSIRVKSPWVVTVCLCALLPMIIVVWLYAIAVSFVG